MAAIKDWDMVGTTLYLLDNRLGPMETDTRIVALDLDETIITTPNLSLDVDWKFLFDNCPAYLKQLHEAGWRLVIFSNRSGVMRRRGDADKLKSRITSVVEKLGVPIDVFVATEKDGNRKPERGMWDLFLKIRNPRGRGVGGYFIGDAEGPTADKQAYRWADSDLKFAQNIGLTFKTPDKFFTGK